MTDNNEQLSPVEVNLETSEPTPQVIKHTFAKSEKGRLTVLFVVLLVLAFLSVFYTLKNTPSVALVTEDIADMATSTVVTSATTTEVSTIDANTKPVWFDEPRRVQDPKFAIETEGDSSDLGYYAIGTYGSGTIMLLNYQYMGYVNLMFLVDGEDVRLLLNHTSPYYYSYFKFSPKVMLDNKIKFEDLSPENTLPIGNDRTIFSSYEASEGKPVVVSEYAFFNKSSFSGKSDYRYDKVDVVGTTSQGPILRGYSENEIGTAMYDYAVKLVGGLMVGYDASLPKYVGYDRVLKFTFNDTNLLNEDMYRIDGMGSCGGGGPEVAIKKVLPEDLRLVGTTITGLDVYTIINPNHPLIKRVFDATGGMYYDFSAETGTAVENYLTPEEFINLLGVLVIEEADGTQLVFTHGEYGPQAECGKPVVYVYPETTTDVTVKVDAYVTKSEPEYNPNQGWKATAHPDGTLIVNGAEYKNLFWDGYGNGLYQKPESGVIVPTDTALAVMSDNLRTMGFIETEIADFVEFWADYMPEEDYTRITWLLTEEMEELAHLSIEPRPDTLIRAFVDYEGVVEPYEITKQYLPNTERRGYVVTEWGGLLRKN